MARGTNPDFPELVCEVFDYGATTNEYWTAEKFIK